MTALLLVWLVSISGSAGLDIIQPELAEHYDFEPLQENDFHFVMGSEMEKRLTEYDDDKKIDVILQFFSRPGEIDLDVMKYLDIDILSKYRVLNAVHAEGKVRALKHLTGYPNLKYMEPNWEIVSDMELSTSVINASRTWSREIVDVNRNRLPIDGSGVTVVVVDTGIDAGHPDMDYGEKTIYNKFLENADTGAWVEQENTDLYYGHGTHVAGTVAGNGDASAGARRGVAPGANLIGVTIYDPTAASYLHGLEWVYDNSRPNSNPHNIRSATNSWHTVEEEYDPESVLSQIIMKMAYENNVISTWSAGNEGRTDPEGDDEITTSKEGNTPVAIMVAAYERDGSAVTDFSSKGLVGLNHTYPDIGAPGRSIWSTSARRTIISGGTYAGGNTNPYYLAISGTSMSTPHVAGLTALLWQACPSMKISARHEDYSGDDESWWSNPETLIHEAEWILEASATYLPPSAETGVPGKANETGMDGRPMDYSQGYGIVDVEKAVGIALTLQRLREMYPTRDITVTDAIGSYREMMLEKETESSTNIVYAEWSGEFSRYNDQFGKPLSTVNQTKHVFAPENAKTAIIDMHYSAVSIDELAFGDLTFTVDFDMDGNTDHTGTLAPTLGQKKHEEFSISESDTGKLWSFDIIGEGFRIIQPLRDRNYVELRIEYTINVQFVLSGGGTDGSESANNSGTYIPYDKYPSIGAPLRHGQPTAEHTGATVTMPKHYYDLTNVHLHLEQPPREPEGGKQISWLPILAAIIILLLIVLLLRARKKANERKLERSVNTE